MLKKIHNKNKGLIDYSLIRWIFAVVSLFSFVLGVVVLYGWATQNRSIIQIHETYAPMQINTALYFVLSGLILATFVLRKKGWALIPLAALYLLSGITILQYLLNIDLGVDRWLFYYDLPIDIKNPGRPAPNTAVCFFILACAMTLTLYCRKGISALISELLACLAISIASSSLFGYILKIYSITTWYDFTGMAIHTSTGIVVLGMGLLLANALYLFYRGKFFFGPLMSLVFIIFYVTYFIWEGATTNQDLAIEKLAKNNASFIAHSLAKNLEYSTKAIRRVVLRWQALGGFNQELWKSDATSYQEDITELFGFFWFDQDLNIQRYLELPEKGAPGLSEERIQEVLKKERFLDEEVEVYHKRLGDNLLILVPLYIDKVFKGALVVDIKLELLIEHSVPEHLKKYYTIGIFDQEDLIFGREGESSADLEASQQAHVDSPLVNWDVIVIPTQKALKQSFPKELIFLSGLLFAVFLGLITYLLKVAAKAKEAAQRAGAYLKAVLEGSSYMIISTNPEGKIVEFNKAAEENLGWRKEELVGKETPNVFHDEEEMKARAIELSEKLGKEISPQFEVFTALSNRELPDIHEWTYIRKDKKRFPVQLSITGVKDDNDEPIGYVGNAIDLTHLKEAERMKNELISITSHELRAPSASIHSSLDLVLGSENLNEEEKSLLTIAYENSRRLIRLTTDILDMQKMESGNLDFVFKIVALGDLLSRAILANAPIAQESGINLKLQEPVPETMLKVDSDRLQQVLTNYISNAIKNSPKGSKILLAAEESEKGIRVSVKDEGPGIPEQYQSLIFQKFSQIPGNTSNNKGTGLGLSIAKAIIEKHEGEVGFDTDPTGTTFWFDLPVRR